MSTTRKEKFYQPELDGLRFFAFLAVFLSHCFSQDVNFYSSHGVPVELSKWIARAIASGGNGVPLFFILSSYLITELLLRELEKLGKINVRAFYMRRMLRIWPLYFAFLLAVFLLFPRGSEYGLGLRPLAAFLLFSGNWLFFIGGINVHSLAGPLWSVSVEEQFYLLWPLVLSGITVWRLKFLIGFMIVSGMIVHIVMDLMHASPAAIWNSTFSWLDSIAAGALLALLLRGRRPRIPGWLGVTFVVAGIMGWVVAARVYGHLPLPDLFQFPFIIVCCGTMLVGALCSSLFANPVLVYLGRISYGLYVFHVAGLTLASLVFPQFSFGGALVGMVVTILCASLSYRFLEAPFLRLKKRFTYIDSRPVDGTVILAEPEPASF